MYLKSRIAPETTKGIYDLRDELESNDGLEGLANLVRYTFCARVILYPDYGITSIEKQSVAGYLNFRMQKAPAGCRGLLKGGCARVKIYLSFSRR